MALPFSFRRATVTAVMMKATGGEKRNGCKEFSKIFCVAKKLHSTYQIEHGYSIAGLQITGQELLYRGEI